MFSIYTCYMYMHLSLTIFTLGQYRTPLFECVANRLRLRDFSRNARLIIARLLCPYIPSIRITLHRVLIMAQWQKTRNSQCLDSHIEKVAYGMELSSALDSLSQEAAKTTSTQSSITLKPLFIKVSYFWCNPYNAKTSILTGSFPW